MLGMYLNVWYLFKQKTRLNVTVSLFIGLIIVVYLFVFLHNTIYIHHDNFSHWGLIVKNLYRNSRFPNFSDQIIRFQSYPTGSACFIWYVCKVIGYSEGNTLFAQSMLIFACIYPFFIMCNGIYTKEKFMLLVLVLAECIVWISYGADKGVGLYQLLVDVLLAAVAVAAFTIVYCLKDEINKAICCAVPLLVFEVCIKNSGVMWVFAIFIELCYFSCKNINENDKIFKVMGGALGIPFLFRVLWDSHIKMVFDNAIETKHAMSIEYWSKAFNEKTKEDLQNITRIFWNRTLSIKSKVTICLIIMVICTYLAYKINKKNAQRIHILFCCCFLIIVSVVYQVGNYFMYIFSMSTSEALRLAEYDRYVMTLECFLSGVIFLFLIILFITYRKEKIILQIYSLAVLIVFEIGVVWSHRADIKYLIYHLNPQVSSNDNITRWYFDRERMDDIVTQYELEEGKNCIIYIGDKEPYYRPYMSRYVLYSNNVRTINSNQINELKNANKYDYAIIMEQDQFVNKWLSDSNIPFENNECLKMDEYQYITLKEYLPRLVNENYISFISVKDEASLAFNDSMVDAMKNIGLTEELMGKYRYSYGAVIDSGQIVYEHLDNKLIDVSGEFLEGNYSLKSAGLNCGNLSSIRINGQEYSLNMRGINIVVYDKMTKQVIDSVNFDTWQVDGTYISK